jgi:hypothetical protein
MGYNIVLYQNYNILQVLIMAKNKFGGIKYILDFWGEHKGG